PVDGVIHRYSDPRIKYIVHTQNQGLSAARNTGICASTGDFIAPLDGDDYFHPEKFQRHVDFLQQHPEIGVTYNARFELNHSAKTIREIWRPSVRVGLAELVQGFPFSPSDMVLRREWAFAVNLFDVRHTYVGEDLDINCRLALAGCQFASVDRALNYRRYHSRRALKNLRSCVDDTIRPLTATFSDQRCPPAVLAIKNQALAMHYLLWSFIACSQDETGLGQEYCRQAIQLHPSFLAGNPSELLSILLSFCIVDESLDHALLLGRILDQLRPEVNWTPAQLKWAVGRGYLLRGSRALLWGRDEDGKAHFARAATLGAQIDRRFLGQLTAQWLDYETEFGSDAVRQVVPKILPELEKFGGRATLRWLKGHYLVNQAFRSYRAGHYTSVPKEVLGAFANNPHYLTNRGVLSILCRSLLGMRYQANG
ncbi:MAG TPA: glycosyltransferase family 2 protein, partial [Caldilineaceae bacterium]|nr:glycosyltransferase family 2 protein [Caldilineaceae bacterium]